MKIGYVVRKNGLVPFDDNVSDAQRSVILSALLGAGHEIEPLEGTRDVYIKNWTKQ